MRKQCVVLKDNANLAQIGRQIIHGTITNHHLTGSLTQETRNNAQKRGFAAAGRAEQGDQFASLHFKRDIIYGTRGPITMDNVIQQQLLRNRLLNRIGQSFFPPERSLGEATSMPQNKAPTASFCLNREQIFCLIFNHLLNNGGGTLQ
jgi:hypothetical protein